MTTGNDGRPRPLPIRPRPAAGENPASYIRRLARANYLRPQYLRRCLHDTATGELRLDWLAVMAGRTQASLERAFSDSRPRPQRPGTRKSDKAALLLTLRREAIDRGLSIRSIADRHGVGQRTVLQALESPVPRPRKQYPSRGSRLEPFHETIEDILRQDTGTPRRSRRTVKSIMDELVNRHGMTGVSYAILRNYIAHQRGLTRLPAPTMAHTDCPSPAQPTSRSSAHRAVRHQDLARLRRLLDAGHDVEDDNGDGWTLLRHAVHAEHDHHIQTGKPLHTDLTAFLLARGADPLNYVDGISIVQEAENTEHWLAAEIMHAWIHRGQASCGNPTPARTGQT